MAKVAYHCLKKIPKGDLAIPRTYPEPCRAFFFLSTLLGPQTCFLFVCELVSVRLSDSKRGNSPPAKVKLVKDYLKLKKKKKEEEENVQSAYNKSMAQMEKHLQGRVQLINHTFHRLTACTFENKKKVLQ